MALLRLCRRAVFAAPLALALGAVAAESEIIEVRHKGVTLIGVPPDPAVDYDVAVIDARQGVENLRAALDMMIERSAYSAAVLETLKSNGNVVIVYHPGFPFEVAASTGTTLGLFDPHLLSVTPDPGGRKNFPVIFSRYAVKWPTEDLVPGLAHELLGHGMQHLRGTLATMSKLDSECEASLYEDLMRQELGTDKHSDITVRFRQSLEWRLCVPFKQYMTKHAPEKMALWETLNLDVPRLLSVFEDYMRATGTR